MGFSEILTTIATIITEVNKADENAQQKRFLATLRKIQRDIEKQKKEAQKHLLIGIGASAVASFVIGYLLK